MEPFFDLASLAKPLVTAPLVLRHLPLDEVLAPRLGFRDLCFTARDLLCHRAGLPPWLPFTGEPLAAQLARGFPVGSHFLLRAGTPGVAQYSDLHYRLLAEALEQQTGRLLAEPPGQQTGRLFADQGADATGLSPAPWPRSPRSLSPGPDAEAWVLAAPDHPLAPQRPGTPHDANARAGMMGHAGFGGTPVQVAEALDRWRAAGCPAAMAQPHAQAADGTVWGLGLQRLAPGPGRFPTLLERLPRDLSGTHVLTVLEEALPPEVPAPEGPADAPSDWWIHLGWTGCALFVRPSTDLAIALLAHRAGPEGTLDMHQLRARRWQALAAWVEAGPRLPGTLAP